jgi:hypothetical protein
VEPFQDGVGLSLSFAMLVHPIGVSLPLLLLLLLLLLRWW